MPVTEALTQQKYRSMSAIDNCLHEWLTRGWIFQGNASWLTNTGILLPRSEWFKRASHEFGHLRGFPDKPQQ
eukprot:COSAG01_NODE_34503_length_546_cov_1.541387_2_plen_72_part_00